MYCFNLTYSPDNFEVIKMK